MLDAARDGRAARDQRHAATERALDHRCDERVVGAAKDHGVDAFREVGTRFLQMPLGDVEHVEVAGATPVGEATPGAAA